jgi:nitroreductase
MEAAMVDIDAVIRSRRSRRTFAATPVTNAEIAALVEAATWAPSAGNRQDWRFTIVRDRNRIAAIADAVDAAWRRIAEASGGIGDEIAAYATGFSWLRDAPALVLVAVRPPPFWLTAATGAAASRIAGSASSAAMAMQNLLLAAEARGLAACICTAPVAAETELRTILHLDRRRELVALVAVGHADGPPPAPPTRRPLTDILELNP